MPILVPFRERSVSILLYEQALGSPSGGNAFGGGIYNEAGTLTIDRSTFTGNEAVAANGGSGGVPVTLPGGISASFLGSAGGGAIWNDGGGLFSDSGEMATVQTSVIAGNRADGGDAGSGGSDGQGIGGGVYHLGTFSVDVATVIHGNHASTSNDDTFGV